MPAIVKRPMREALTTRHFRRSSNVERDRDNRFVADDFILTACARTTLLRLLEGLHPNSEQRAWTLTGPFGTGKSSFCLFAAALLSQGGEPATRRARSLIAQVDAAVAKSVTAQYGHNRGVVSVLITGCREPLQAAIARGLAIALRDIRKAGSSRLVAEIESIARTVPPHFPKLVERVAKYLVDNAPAAQGCLLIIDELGKLLEFAAANPDRTDVYLLQQIAELACKPNSPLAVLGVLHQDFSGYAKALLPAQQQEWEKVRGRFEDIVFEQSADDMIRLISEAIERSHDKNIMLAHSDRAKYHRLCREAVSLGLLTSAKTQQNVLGMLKKCAPLHPAVMLLIGPVFKRFGQNERSAFSFLRSAEPFGLNDFRARRTPGTVYRLVDLYQYLVTTFGDVLLASRDGRRWADAFNAEAQHPDLPASESDVLRTIALLTIIGRWHGVPATADAIHYSLLPQLTRPQVESALESLKQKSAIVYRKFNKSYGLWEGSDIDVEAKIAEARAGQAADAPTTHLLRGIYAPRPLVARRHSFERGTLRYFDIIPVSPKLPDEAAVLMASSTGDGHLLILLHDFSDPNKVPTSLVNTLTESSKVVLCVPAMAREVDSLARELAAIEVVARSVRELHNDQTALRELQARRDEIRRRLDHALADLLTPGRPSARATRWIRNGKEIRIRSRRELNERLSAVCDELFADCPTIQNEIINRRELSSSAAAGQGALLKAMVEHGEIEGLAIEGNPAEKSIYLSVLRRLGLHRKHADRWQFSAGPTNLESSARPMMKAIRHFLDESSTEAKPLDELFDLLRAQPFGVRDGVIPIIVCAAILAHEADVAIYENGAFIPQLTAPVLEKLVKSPGSFAVRRWHVDGVRAVVFEQLAQMLGQSAVAGKIEQRDLLDVVKPLLRFIRRLNDFCRSTNTFSPTAIAVRYALGEASEPDQLLFTALPKACGVSPFSAKKPGKADEVQRFRRTLQNALAELQKGYDTLLHSLLEELGAALESPPHPRGTRASLRHRASQVAAIALNSELRVFSARLADAAADDRSWIESIASFLSNKHPSQWTDDDRARLGVRLAQIASAFRSLETLTLSRKQDACETTDESIHLAVVGTSFPESKLVVHISPDEVGTVSKIERRLLSALDAHRNGGERRLLVAALARVVRTTLSNEAVSTNPERVPT